MTRNFARATLSSAVRNCALRDQAFFRTLPDHALDGGGAEMDVSEEEGAMVVAPLMNRTQWLRKAFGVLLFIAWTLRRCVTDLQSEQVGAVTRVEHSPVLEEAPR